MILKLCVHELPQLLIVIFLFKVLNLNDYDKLYLLMCKWRIIRLFNPLCYTADVTSVEDLEKKVRANLDDIKQKLPAWSQSQSFREDLETIKNFNNGLRISLFL